MTGVLDHAAIRVPDLEAARRFYDAVFGALGVPCVGSDADWIGYGLRAEAGHPRRSYVSIRRGPGTAPGTTWAFAAATPARVEAFRVAGLAAGGREAPDDAPGLRGLTHAVLLDPAGHRVAAVWRG